MVTTGREVWRNRRQIGGRTDLEDQVHSYHDVEKEVTVEQPETWKRELALAFVLTAGGA